MSKTAVIATGGKQYVVEEGAVLSIEAIPGQSEVGTKLTFDQVLMVDDGKEAKVGTPTVSGASVTGEVMDAGLGPKLLVQHFRAKSNYFKKKGHRQPFLKVKVTGIK